MAYQTRTDLNFRAVYEDGSKGVLCTSYPCVIASIFPLQAMLLTHIEVLDDKTEELIDTIPVGAPAYQFRSDHIHLYKELVDKIGLIDKEGWFGKAA